MVSVMDGSIAEIQLLFQKYTLFFKNTVIILKPCSVKNRWCSVKMFLKKRLVNGTYYWSIAENFREAGKVKQRIITNLGNTEKALKILQENTEYQSFLPALSDFMKPRSNLIWFGGKGRMASTILDYFPEHKTFVDLFGGGANMLVQKKRSLVDVYNDIDGEVVNYLTVLREEPEMFYKAVESLPYSRQLYNEYRKSPVPENPFDRAVRWFYINRSGMPGSHRGVPGGWKHGVQHNTVGSYRSACKMIRPMANRLKNVMLENKDYREVFLKYDHPETFFYIDPPYVGRERRYAGNFTWQDHVDLANLVRNMKGQALISYYPDESVFSLYEGFNIVQFKSKAYSTKVSAGQEKPETTELLIMNYGIAM